MNVESSLNPWDRIKWRYVSVNLQSIMHRICKVNNMLGEHLKSMVGLIQLDAHGMQMKNPQIKDGPLPQMLPKLFILTKCTK